MIRTDSAQLDMWSAILPSEVWALPNELQRVDVLLDDRAVVAPLADVFGPDIGSRCYLKDRYQFSDAVPLQEVSDSIHGRRFCHLGLADPVPHPTSLTKWRHRLGSEAIAKVNAAVIDGLRDEKVIPAAGCASTRPWWSNIHYPTDSQLIADGLRNVTRVGQQIREFLGDGVERRGPRP